MEGQTKLKLVGQIRLRWSVKTVGMNGNTEETFPELFVPDVKERPIRVLFPLKMMFLPDRLRSGTELQGK